MMLTVLIFGLILGGCFAWFIEYKWQGSAKHVCAVLLIAAIFGVYSSFSNGEIAQSQLTEVVSVPWISDFNIYFTLGGDYLSGILIFLTLFLAMIAILVSWQEIGSKGTADQSNENQNQKVGFYYANIMFATAGIIGVFSAIDMFLFFFFWEVMLLPITALIAIWGHENRYFAAIKFFIFTQLSSLCMLIAIIAMAFWHKAQLGVLSFNYLDWLNVSVPLEIQWYLMLGFFIAFAVKLPCVPVHSWLPDAHTQAPTAGSVLLAGILLKTGAFGLIRFVIQLYPEASSEFAQYAAVLGVISILYGAQMAFSQTDFKRLVAYSSISHMGFVTLALFSFNQNAYNGAIVTMLAHGLSSAALFSMAGMIYTRVHSRELTDMGGIGSSAPIMTGFALTFCAAAVGMPGLANFIGEFLSLLGAFQRFPVLVSVAVLGIIASAVYGMRLFQKSFHGSANRQVADLSQRELIICMSLVFALLLFGLFPQLILDGSLPMEGSYG